MYIEANFDGLVGPTHNYAGLSVGNVASESNASAISNPKAAALQGLDKMKALHDLGMVQGVFAPQSRPDLKTLRRLGFHGSDHRVLNDAFEHAPALLSATYSASSMWTANAATVSPSPDTEDGKVHFTPANLVNKFHRAIEPEQTGQLLKAVFSDKKHFVHHQHLPEHELFGDEGAANHTRLCPQYGHSGAEFFVFGRYGADAIKPSPIKYPARQTREACEAIARLHGLNPSKTVIAQQNPAVIDQGVFHNDVIAVGNRDVLFYHQQAFLNTEQVKADLTKAFGDDSLHFIEVLDDEVSVADSIKSYLFNTQLLMLTDGSMAIIAPKECEQTPSVKRYLDELVTRKTPIEKVHYFDVKQSMQNGGGPACLRLRVVLSQQELTAVNQACLINDEKYQSLYRWVEKHYRDRLTFDDLRDPMLVTESNEALDELTQLLELGSLYPFQR